MMGGRALLLLLSLSLLLLSLPGMAHAKPGTEKW